MRFSLFPASGHTVCWFSHPQPVCKTYFMKDKREKENLEKGCGGFTGKNHEARIMSCSKRIRVLRTEKLVSHLYDMKTLVSNRFSTCKPTKLVSKFYK